MDTPPCKLCCRPSVYYCSCQSPPSPFCHDCSYMHHATAGSHSWAKFEQPEIKNTSCEVCQERTAVVVCCCKFPVAPLCAQCRSDHEDKDPLAVHLRQPVKKIGVIKSLEDIENAIKVMGKKNRIEEYLNKNKTAAAKLKDEVEILASDLIARINSAKEETVREITKFERDIEERRQKFKQEVEVHLFEIEAQCFEVLAREAFDTSKQFVCTEVLQGELRRGGPIDSRLVKLQIPQFFRVREKQLLEFSDREVKEEETRVPGRGDALLNTQSLADNTSYRQGMAELQSFPSLHSSLTLFTGSGIEVSEELIAEVHAPCKEDFEQQVEEKPKTIGRHRLPFNALQGAFKRSKVMVSKFQQLSDKYSSWRRCRRDGNCFYRCVGVLLCEHYCRPDTLTTELYQLWRAMMEQNSPYNVFLLDPKNLSSMKTWVKVLKHLYEARCNGENALQKLQYYLQIPLVDKAIVAAMRNYTASCFQLAAGTPEIQDFLPGGAEPVLREIISDGIEAEGISQMFTARALKVVLHVITVSSIATETVYGPAESGWYPALHLLHLPGSYQILIPNQWEAADKYDFVTNTYSSIETGRIVDYEEYQPST